MKRCFPRLALQAASSLKQGMILKTEEGIYFEVTAYQHLKSSQGRTSSIIEYLNMSTLKYGKFTVNTDRQFEVVDLKRVHVLVQYITESYLVACDASTYDEVNVPIKLVRLVKDYLLPGTSLTLLVHDSEILKIVLPRDILAKLNNETLPN